MSKRKTCDPPIGRSVTFYSVELALIGLSDSGLKANCHRLTMLFYIFISILYFGATFFLLHFPGAWILL